MVLVIYYACFRAGNNGDSVGWIRNSCIELCTYDGNKGSVGDVNELCRGISACDVIGANANEGTGQVQNEQL